VKLLIHRTSFLPVGFPHFAALQYFAMVKIWAFLELLLCSNHFRCNFESAHCGDGAISMTMQFVDGFLAALLPSMLMVGWLLWRASPAD
jgi:hypothetical protein